MASKQHFFRLPVRNATKADLANESNASKKLVDSFISGRMNTTKQAEADEDLHSSSKKVAARHEEKMRQLKEQPKFRFKKAREQTKASDSEQKFNVKSFLDSDQESEAEEFNQSKRETNQNEISKQIQKIEVKQKKESEKRQELEAVSKKKREEESKRSLKSKETKAKETKVKEEN